MTAAAGGYVESSYITGKSLSDYGNVTRSATLVLRVPAAGLDAYVVALSGSFNVLSRQGVQRTSPTATMTRKRGSTFAACAGRTAAFDA